MEEGRGEGREGRSRKGVPKDIKWRTVRRFTCCDAAGATVTPGAAGAAPPAPAETCAPTTLAELPTLCTGLCGVALGDAERGEVGRVVDAELAWMSLSGVEEVSVGRWARAVGEEDNIGRGNDEEVEVDIARVAEAGILGFERTRKEAEGEEERFRELDLTRLGAEGEVGRGRESEEESAPLEWDCVNGAAIEGPCGTPGADTPLSH